MFRAIAAKSGPLFMHVTGVPALGDFISSGLYSEIPPETCIGNESYNFLPFTSYLSAI